MNQDLHIAGDLAATIFNTIDALVIVLYPDGRIVMTNDAVNRMLGYSSTELSGRFIWDGLLHADEIEGVKEIFFALVAGKARSSYTNDMVAKGGRRRTITWSNSVMADERGHVRYVIGTGVDVTERKDAMDELRWRESYLRSIFETAVDGIITIDASGVVQSMSPSAERMFGVVEEDVAGQNISILMPEPDRGAHDRYIETYLATGEARIIGIGREVVARRSDGSIFPIRLGVSEFTVDGERYFTGMVRDISEERAREEAYRQFQKMEAIGQLTGGVAHDFNNLLTVMIGNLEMLEARLGDDAERPRELVSEALEAAELGAQLTDRLLAFARRQTLAPTVVDLNDLVLGTSELLNRTLGENIKINVVLASGLDQTSVDPGQVENALLNLVINARDAMPGGGSVTIETANVELDEDYATLFTDVVPGPYVLLSVTDTGHGIPPELRERVFEPFFTTKETGAGTGLGLSMVYGFVKQSGGHVRIYSEVDYGTTVNIYLPKVLAAEPAAEAEAPRDEGTLAGRGEMVLVAEDDPRVRRITVARLQELGYRVREAENGRAAVAALEENGPVDLLFTDVIMPGGMTGRDLSDLVRERWPEVRILLTSGYAEPALAETDLMAAGTRLLRKPYTLRLLAQAVRETLDD